MNALPDPQTLAVNHYENFPVASWLCPPALRPAVAALYAFARTADDLADEGDAPWSERLADLAAFGDDLRACARGEATTARWAAVFAPLAVAIARHRLPLRLLQDLLSAFEQDVERTRDGRGYADRDDLLDYCSRSASPVGRLLLHLYRVDDPAALAESDDVCSALQLINFWQDLSLDIPRGRFYLPAQDCRRHGLDPLLPHAWPGHPAGAALLREQATWARQLMLRGAGIAHRVPGRAGWELRAVVQGGLRILDKVDRLGPRLWHERPQLGTADGPVIVWRCLRMRLPAQGPMGEFGA